MKRWQRVGTLITTAALGLLTLMPVAPSFADSFNGQRWGVYDRQDFRGDQRGLWRDRGEIRQDLRELQRDQRAHRWGEVAQDRRELWKDQRELWRDSRDYRYERRPWWGNWYDRYEAHR